MRSPVSPVSRHDAIVVGSGPGGASVARELARRGARVLLLERGGAAPIAGTAPFSIATPRCSCAR
jgi:choline dehydrogenase-like flavoprotein